VESSVKYIQLENAGQKPALCFRAEKIAYCIINDEIKIRTLEVSLVDHDRAQFVKRLGQNYLPRAFAEAMLKQAKSKPITRRAAFLVEKGEKLAIDAKLPPDELNPETEVSVPVQEIAAEQEQPAPVARKGPRRVEKTPTPTPIAPLPSKAAAGAKKAPEAKAKRAAKGRTLVSVLASELGIAEQACRVKLRAAGMRAPYDDGTEEACRKALGLTVKGKKK
jgi:hypothetical protein